MGKTFKDKIQQKAVNPTLQFISAAQTTPEGEGLSPIGRSGTDDLRQHSAGARTRETRSRRLQLLITPTLFDALRQEADDQQTSVNDLVNSILDKAMKARN